MLNKTVIKLCFRNFQQYKIQTIITTVIIIFFTTVALLTDNKQGNIKKIVTVESEILPKRNLVTNLFLLPSDNQSNLMESNPKSTQNISYLNSVISLKPTANFQTSPTNSSNLILFLTTIISLLCLLLTTVLARLQDWQIMKILGKNLLVRIIFYEAFFICLISFFTSCFLSIFFAIFFDKALNCFLSVALTVVLATIFAGIITLTMTSQLGGITDEFS